MLVSGVRFQVSGYSALTPWHRKPYMKLRQNGIVSFSIRLAAFQASGGARVKLHKIRCRSKKYLTAEIAEYAEIIQFFFSAFSAISAVNSYVSFLIRLAAFQARGGARMKLHEIQCRFHEFY